MKKKKITIHDIAAKSGVSIATVSRVINGKSNVIPETRKNVLNAIAQLEEEYGTKAKATAKMRTPVILLAIDFGSPLLNDFSNGLQEALSEKEYYVFAIDSSKRPSDFINEINYLSNFVSISGIVLTHYYGNTADLERLQERYPVVAAGSPCIIDNVPSVAIDNHQAGLTIANHLLSLDCHNVVVMYEEHDFSIIRRDAVLETYENAGFPVPDQNIMQLPGLDFSVASSRLRRYLSSYPAPDAIIAINDALASLTIHEIRRCGLRVPDDIRVVGFDNSEMAVLTSPTLTTIDQHAHDLGMQAANIILDIIGNHLSAPQHIIVQGDLIVRESTLR